MVILPVLVMLYAGFGTAYYAYRHGLFGDYGLVVGSLFVISTAAIGSWAIPSWPNGSPLLQDSVVADDADGVQPVTSGSGNTETVAITNKLGSVPNAAQHKVHHRRMYSNSRSKPPLSAPSSIASSLYLQSPYTQTPR
jgi:hypothetical protein